jgi:hypothetical protein
MHDEVFWLRYRAMTIKMESLPVSRSRVYHGCSSAVHQPSWHVKAAEPAGDRQEICERTTCRSKLLHEIECSLLASLPAINWDSAATPSPADDAPLAMALPLMRCSKGHAARLASTTISKPRLQSPRYPRYTAGAHDIPRTSILRRVVARNATRTSVDSRRYLFSAA